MSRGPAGLVWPGPMLAYSCILSAGIPRLEAPGQSTAAPRQGRLNKASQSEGGGRDDGAGASS
eukprot:60160-Pyramimonas_sp.AAC.1